MIPVMSNALSWNESGFVCSLRTFHMRAWLLPLSSAWMYLPAHSASEDPGNYWFAKSYLAGYCFTRMLFRKFLRRDDTWEKRNFSHTCKKAARVTGARARKTAAPRRSDPRCRVLRKRMIDAPLFTPTFRRPHLCYHMTDVMSYCARKQDLESRNTIEICSYRWLFRRDVL